MSVARIRAFLGSIPDQDREAFLRLAVLKREHFAETLELAGTTTFMTTYVCGLAGRRDCYANLLPHPEFVLHLKESVRADLPALVRAIGDRSERESVLRDLLNRIGRADELPEWVAASLLGGAQFEPAPRPGLGPDRTLPGDGDLTPC